MGHHYLMRFARLLFLRHSGESAVRNRGVEGLFDGADIAAFKTRDIRIKVRLSRAGEIMTAALRAFRGRSDHAFSPTGIVAMGKLHQFKSCASGRAKG